MRYHEANEIYLPTGIDKRFDEINKELEVIDWLTVRHGRAWRVSESSTKQNKQKFKLLTDGDFLTLAKDDDVSAFSFWVADDFETVIENGQGGYEREVGLVVVANLPRIGKKDYIYTEELKQEVMSVLTTIPFCDVTRYYDNDTKRVFGGVNLENTGFELTVFPFATLRFNIKIKYGNYCV